MLNLVSSTSIFRCLTNSTFGGRRRRQFDPRFGKYHHFHLPLLLAVATSSLPAATPSPPALDRSQPRHAHALFAAAAKGDEVLAGNRLLHAMLRSANVTRDIAFWKGRGARILSGGGKVGSGATFMGYGATATRSTCAGAVAAPTAGQGQGSERRRRRRRRRRWLHYRRRCHCLLPPQHGVPLRRPLHAAAGESSRTMAPLGERGSWIAAVRRWGSKIPWRAS